MSPQLSGLGIPVWSILQRCHLCHLPIVESGSLILLEVVCFLRATRNTGKGIVEGRVRSRVLAGACSSLFRASEYAGVKFSLQPFKSPLSPDRLLTCGCHLSFCFLFVSLQSSYRASTVIRHHLLDWTTGSRLERTACQGEAL